ncbi:molybdenum ABC transporter ATP-binding protein [Neptuniibacter halophilus]|uniref:molybdenum ABC transporter ATP-binding protein n=1 Tax=Neptuniibacter halophilus TaxID=651666 RepID=UPI0025732331|nr:molybdenum ABC transporter ATP-binding protein [Neptuniibacter halophilus]
MAINTEPCSAEPIRARFRLDYTLAQRTGFSLDLDLTLPAQGVTAIFGHSGSGKTTFLRCVAGLEQPDAGELRVNGQIWQQERFSLATYKRPLGYVFQESSLFAHLNARENLKYAIKRSGQPCDNEFYQQVLDIMGINTILSRYPDQLSGGERQRVAIARALLIQPKLLLMDEPLAGLDIARKLEILPYLERLRQHFAIPMLYVSHSIDEVTRLADYTVVLEQGRVIAEGRTTEVFSRIDLPIRFEQDAGAVIPGTLVERDEQWKLIRMRFSGGELWLRDSGTPLGDEIRVRILARDISLALTPQEDISIQNRLPVEIVEIAPDQDEAMTMVRLKAGNEYLIARITRRAAAQLNLAPGKQIWAQIKSVAIVA